MADPDPPVESSPPAEPSLPPGPALTPVPPKTHLAWVEVVLRQLGVALLTLLVISIVTFAAMNYKSPEDIAQGDFGASVVTDRPVREDITPRFIRTFILSLLALAVALPMSVALGVFMARRIGRPSDFTLLIGTVILAALPEVVVGICLL